MMLKVARPTVPPALLYAPNIIANTEAAMDAARQARGKTSAAKFPTAAANQTPTKNYLG